MIVDDSRGLNTTKEAIKNNEILKEIKQFYEELFTKKGNQSKETCQSFLNEINTPLVSEHDKNKCDKELTLSDLKDALLSMKDNKSPGNDGLTK